MHETVKRILTSKIRKDTQLLFENVMAAPILLHGRENRQTDVTDYLRELSGNLTVTKQLQIFDIEEMTADRKNNCYGHFGRQAMPSSR